MLRMPAQLSFLLFCAMTVLTQRVVEASDNGLSQEAGMHVQEVVNAFMEEFGVPGVSLAISKDGRLVLAEGFGWADRDREEPMTPAHRFRIASISKPITSLAVHKLMEDGKLELDQRVFGPGALLGDDYGSEPYEQRLQRITLRHLLEHSPGGWDNKNDDPMFLHAEFDHDRLISWTLDHQRLKQDPGAAYAYSNFGYCLLGRIIERAAGTSYENFVREAIFKPCGATSFALGGNKREDRLPGEVIYYGQAGQDPYRMNVARMDSHGGWVASASDLVRVAVRCDGFDSSPDLFQKQTIRSMTTPSKANPGYAKGWLVNARNNWWHTGSLPGSRSILVRTHHGFCWAVLTNTRSPKPEHAAALDRMTWEILKGVQEWPDHDLFRATK